ncbi:MAG: transcription negative regulator ChrR [Phormidesmis priestleyi]|uniref:Transcription negative regulator ChrR n=1 Tax=Phormidesmis priestleyi TaxID=268141 RepID=A0A2W4WRY1_9CYAN|nr:MAG: transcription negative regulator ChrR [Phormidesmis priestleyi]
MILHNLFSLAERPEQLAWEPFRPGVTICRLYDEGQQGSSAALLKYDPGAAVPTHSHTGYEHIIVLSGAQSDYQGTHKAGTLVINPPDSSHQVASEEGCIVLVIWAKPVVIADPEG